MSWQGAGQNPAPGWYPDPSRRFEQRYWDGGRWTEHVVRQGQRLSDPPPVQRQQQPARQPAPQPQPQPVAVPGWQAAQAAPASAAPAPPAAHGGQPPPGGYPPAYHPARRLSARNLMTGRYAIPGRVGPGIGAIAAKAERPPVGRSLLQTGAVFAFIIVMALGGVVVGRILETPREAPVQVGTDVTIKPLTGWQVKESDAGALWLTRGSANMRVVVGPGGGDDPRGLAGAALDGLKAQARGPLLVTDPESLTVGGHPASRVAYQGQFGSGGRVTIVQGEVTAVVTAAGNGVVFDGWALPESYPYQEGDVHKMIEEAEIR